MTPKQDIFVRLGGNTFYPVDDDLRAKLTDGNQKSCPMPQRLAMAQTMPKIIADVEVSFSRGFIAGKNAI